MALARIILLFFCCVVVWGSRTEAQQGLLKDLGHNFLDSSASWVNDRGDVVGWTEVKPTNEIHAFKYSNNKMTDLGTLGGSMSYATGINSQGTVVGASQLPNGLTQAFVRHDGGRMQKIPNLPGDVNSFALGINDSGVIVGQFDIKTGGRRAFVYFDSTSEFKDLGTFGGDFSIVRSINKNGDLAGAATMPVLTDGSRGPTIAFVCSPPYDKLIPLETLGGTDGSAFGINNLGDVVGGSLTVSGATHAFLYSNGVIHDLHIKLAGGQSVAYSINDARQIVGYSDAPNGVFGIAFEYSNQTVTRIPDLRDGDFAYCINNRGQIVGSFFGLRDGAKGYTHAFLYTPKR